MSQSKHVPAVFYFAAAKSYRSYLALGQRVGPLSEGEEVALLAPRSLLAGFALELYFKAVLRHAGMDDRTLKSRAYGHDLGRLYAGAVAHGLVGRVEVEALVEQFGPMHGDFGLRYFRPGTEYLVTDFDFALELMGRLEAEVGGVIGVPVSNWLESER